MTWECALHSEDETRSLAGRLATLLQPGDVIGLEGPLGAGKTLLIRNTIYALGLPDEVAVPSPTFTLVQHYDARVPVVHADLYRLADDSELVELGLAEAATEAITFVEWGRRLAEFEAMASMWITLAVVDDVSRIAIFESHTDRGAALIEALR